MNSVLFVLGGGIGNIVQATPAIQAVAAEGWIVDLLLHCNSSNDLDIFRLPCVREVYTKAPKCKYDFQLNGPFTPNKKHMAKKLLKTRVNYAQHTPEAEVYYDLAKQIGVKISMGDSDIHIGKKGPWPKNTRTVAIYPGSKPDWAMKRWDKFDHLAERLDGNVIVIGKDSDINSHGNPTWIKRSWNWPEKTEFFSGSLTEAALLISRCKFFVGNDGGLAHVAAATGTPTFVLFGPSSDIKNKPFSSTAYSIGIDLDCRPCQFQPGGKNKQIFDGGKGNCQRKMKCMRDMSVDFVMDAINLEMNIE